jgi:hypothetical protein
MHTGQQRCCPFAQGEPPTAQIEEWTGIDQRAKMTPEFILK